VFKEVLKKAGLPAEKFSLHHLRHTFATLLLQENGENIDLRVLQEIMGHESLATTPINFLLILPTSNVLLDII
jgi:integrase/recombinase XerD